MPITGKHAELLFNGTSFGPADCLQGGNIGDSAQDITYLCNDTEKHIAGVRSTSLSVSMALPESNMLTVMSCIYAGAEATSANFAWFPGGHSSGAKVFPMYTASKTICTQSNVSAPINGVIALDANFVLDTVTISVATT